jgi:hypothetical protein
MNGLLGTADDPRTMGLLSMGLRLMSTPGKFGSAFGQAGLGALGDMQQAQQMQEQRKRAGLQEQLVMLQLAQAKQQQEQAAQAQARQQAIEGAYRGALRSPAQQALAGGGGPTVGNAQAMQGMQPQLDQSALIQGLMQADPMSAAKMLTPQPGDYKVVGDALVQTNAPGGPKPVYKGEKSLDPNKPFLFLDGKIVPNPAYQQYAKDVAAAGAAKQSLSVNTGQKGLDNTLKLRGDFRSEPIYKAHQDVQSAHSQITQSLKQASPAGDLAGATKLMKILDPGSVVRESELGMAIAASGLGDRIQNYASMVITGQKLTPTQRKDFQTLADTLRVESEKQYNAKRKEYEGIATRNSLNVDDVLGPASTSTAVDPFGIR